MKRAESKLGGNEGKLVIGLPWGFETLEDNLRFHLEKLELIGSLIQKASAGDYFDELSHVETCALGGLLNDWISEHRRMLDSAKEDIGAHEKE